MGDELAVPLSLALADLEVDIVEDSDTERDDELVSEEDIDSVCESDAESDGLWVRVSLLVSLCVEVEESDSLAERELEEESVSDADRLLVSEGETLPVSDSESEVDGVGCEDSVADDEKDGETLAESDDESVLDCVAEEDREPLSVGVLLAVVDGDALCERDEEADADSE